MSNKLQELTDKLYLEGLSKGKEEGELILSKAKSQAEDIVNKAKQEAETILENANKQALELRAKAESDIITASNQSLRATKKDIETLLVNATVSSKVDQAFSDPNFVKEIIKTLASKFCLNEDSMDISLLLPATMQTELEAWVNTELASSLKKGISAQFSKKVSGGFTIGPKDGSWFVSFTEESFKELIAEYIRPVTRKILFGK